MDLAIFDFDGTLFATPDRPAWWPWQGFWGRVESLSPPYVPERPPGDWWVPVVVSAAKKAIADPNTYVVLLTGRPTKLAQRVKELLTQQGLRFDEYLFSPGDSTLPMKLGAIDRLVQQLQPNHVTMWEDRSEHIGDFERKLADLGVAFKVHKMPRATHEMENAPTIAFRVAARYADIIGDPVSLISKFEAAINDLAILEKHLPGLQEGERLFNTEGKLWSYADHQRMKQEGDPKWKQVMEYLSSRYDFVLKVKLSSYLFQKAQAAYLFLGILQQYALPAGIRKSIEAAAKYHAKTRRAPAKEAALEAYMKMMEVVRGHLAAAKAAIAQGKPRAQQGGDELRAGPFRVVNTGGFDDDVLAEAAGVVEKATRLLKAKGITKPLYGDVLVSRTLDRQKVLAFYLTEKDELFVRANLRGKHHDAVRTVIHELGHRLHFKFLTGKNQEIKRIYADIARKASSTKMDKIRDILKDHPILPGDKYIEKGEEWVVTGTDSGRDGIIVKMTRKLEDPETNQSLVINGRIALVGYLVNQGLVTNEKLTGFVTQYAAKDYAENFAEMIAAWCLDKLPEDQVALLQSVL